MLVCNSVNISSLITNCFAELLKSHYDWWKSTEGRAQAGQWNFPSDVFMSSAESGNSWTHTVEQDGDKEDEGHISDEGEREGDGSADVTERVPSVEGIDIAFALGETGSDEDSVCGRTVRRSSSSEGQHKYNAEVMKLIHSEYAPGEANAAYCNSIPRLYLIIHNIEEAFHHSYGHGKYPTETYVDIYRALSVLAECPVISLIASMTSVNTPLHLGWDSGMMTRFNWKFFHTPTFVDHDILPELVRACETASTRGGAESGRSAKTLKYILRSLTKKHCDVLKYLLKAQELTSATAKKESKGRDGGAKSGADVAASVAAEGKGVGVTWTLLFSQCVNQFIVKTDSELRQLISELKDQRIVRSYTDADGIVMVALVLSPGEVHSALNYFTNKTLSAS